MPIFNPAVHWQPKLGQSGDLVTAVDDVNQAIAINHRQSGGDHHPERPRKDRERRFRSKGRRLWQYDPHIFRR